MGLLNADLSLATVPLAQYDDQAIVKLLICPMLHEMNNR